MLRPASGARRLLIVAAATVAIYPSLPVPSAHGFSAGNLCPGLSLGSPGATFTVGGGSGSVEVTAPGDCDWIASSPVPWIVMGNASGTGNGTVTFTVQEDRTGAPRNANLTIGGQTFTVTQEIAFYDPVIHGLTIRAIHVIELRIRIDVLRERLAMAAFPWTDPVVVIGATIVQTTHVGELRQALMETYTQAGYHFIVLTGSILPGNVIRGAHMTELRDGVENLEEQLGPVPRR